MTSLSAILARKGSQRTTAGNRSTAALICFACVADGARLTALRFPNRFAVTQARRYDEATSVYPGFVASRRNYDIGEGIDAEGRPRSGVLEASWRVGGATGAEVLALTAFKQDPSLHVIDVSHIEEFGQNRRAPDGATVLFEGDDPRDGPMLRYTIVNRMERRPWRYGRVRTIRRADSGDSDRHRAPVKAKAFIFRSRAVFQKATGLIHRGTRAIAPSRQ